MIIGLTGRNAAGKGAAADFLKSKGFTFHSLSDVIREEVKRRGLELTRDALIATGRELRAHHGTGYLAERILERIEPGMNYVVDSFRHEDEVAVFRKSSKASTGPPIANQKSHSSSPRRSWDPTAFGSKWRMAS